MSERARRRSKRESTVVKRPGLSPWRLMTPVTATAQVTWPLDERASPLESSPVLSGGDVDADWQNAASSGEEAVGGSAPTPDQDIVDEIGRALGVEQPFDAEVTTSDEILHDRDRRYWQLEREAAEDENEEEENGSAD
jgi:uncharacterized protein DUF6335